MFLTRMNVLNVTCVFLYLRNLDYIHLVMEDIGETVRNFFTVMVTNISFRNYSCFSSGVYNFFQIYVRYLKTVGAKNVARRKLQSEPSDL